MNKKLKTKIIFILISLAVGGLSAFLTRGNMNVFDEIVKPPLTPPAIVFPIAWTILYILMGISAGRVYLEHPEAGGIKVFAANLIVNFFWSIIFFNMRAFGFSFVWLLLLIAIVSYMIVKFYQVDKVAAYLQLPYFFWLLFAGYLNLFIFLAN